VTEVANRLNADQWAWLINELSTAGRLIEILHDLAFDGQEASCRIAPEDVALAGRCQQVISEAYAALGGLLCRAASAPGISHDLQSLYGRTVEARRAIREEMRGRGYAFRRPVRGVCGAPGEREDPTR
jgi:hypothetical protein